MALDYCHQITKVLPMTLREYEGLKKRSRRKLFGSWYNVYSYQPLGAYFHRTPMLVVKLILTPYVNGGSS